MNKTKYNEQDVRETMAAAWQMVSEGCEFKNIVNFGYTTRVRTECKDERRKDINSMGSPYNCSFYFCKKIEMLRKLHAGVK